MEREGVTLPAQRLVPGGPRKEEANAVRRREYQRDYLYQTGKRRKVWRTRFQEPGMRADGAIDRVLRNKFIAEVRHVPSCREAQALLDDRLSSLNQGSHKPQLGHADIETTLAVYTHLVEHSQRRAVERVESLIFPNLSQVAAIETGPAKLIQ